MHSSPYNLDSTLKSLPSPDKWPMSLPPVHVSVARWFESIVKEGVLEPRSCIVFNEDLLYFFYGGVFYRTNNNPTRNAVELPIAFVFDPSILSSFVRYYPFDTGAMAADLYGDWGNRFAPFQDRFKVSGNGQHTIPSQIVYHIYSTNDRYLHGEVDSELINKPEPLPQLFEFISADLSYKGIDQRQCIIECQTNAPVSLEKGLLWVGFPECMTDVFTSLYELTKPSMPEFFQYDSHVIFNPSDIAAKLELRAADVIKRFVQLPVGRGK